MQRANPFTPGFDDEPRYLGGRDEIVGRLEAMAGAPHRKVLLLGARGLGKTVLLKAAQRTAIERGWHVIPVLHGPNVFEGMAVRLRRVREELDGGASKLASVDVGGSVAGVGARVGVARQTAPSEAELSALTQLEVLLDEVGQLAQRRGTGLLLVIDEIHRVEPGALEDLVIRVREAVNAYPVSVLGAALSGFKRSLQVDGPTFLARAEHIDVDALDPADVEQCIVRTVASGGGDIEPAALDRFVAATGGHPYVLQLVGSRAWDAADDGHLTDEAVVEGIRRAAVRVADDLLAPVWRTLTDDEKAALVLLARADGELPIAELVKTFGLDSGVVLRELEANGLVAADADQQLVRVAHRGYLHWLRDVVVRPLPEPRVEPPLVDATRGAALEEAMARGAGAPAAAGGSARCEHVGARSHKRCALPLGHRGQHRY